MPFEDFYKAEDEARRQRWQSVGIGLLPLAFVALVCFFSTARTEKAVPQPPPPPPDSERLARLDQICDEIPKPEQFFVVERTSLVSSYTIEVNYRYKSARSYEEIAPFFAIWFDSNGWRRDRSEFLQFRKDKMIVSIQNFYSNGEYVIRCAEEQGR